MPVDSYDCSILRMLFGGKRRQTFIGFDGFVILEQHLVSAAQFRFAHKYDDACGKSVNESLTYTRTLADRTICERSFGTKVLLK